LLFTLINSEDLIVVNKLRKLCICILALTAPAFAGLIKLIKAQHQQIPLVLPKYGPSNRVLDLHSYLESPPASRAGLAGQPLRCQPGPVGVLRKLDDRVGQKQVCQTGQVLGT
jgi:hypothetical protein